MEMKYYSLKQILKKNAQYNIIIGERSNGKTYACLLHCLKEYICNGNQFAIVRRWKEDVRGKRASTIFNSICANNEISELTNEQFLEFHANIVNPIGIVSDIITSDLF